MIKIINGHLFCSLCDVGPLVEVLHSLMPVMLGEVNCSTVMALDSFTE